MKTSQSTLRSFVAALAVLAAASAQSATTWTYSPDASNTGARTISGVTVTPAYTWNGSAYFGTSSSMLQIGKTSNNAKTVSYSFTAFSSAVRKVTVTGKTASGNSESVGIFAKMGSGSSFSVSGSLTSKEGSVVLTAPASSQSGTLSVLLDNPKATSANSKSQAIYLRSIVVELNTAPTALWSQPVTESAVVGQTVSVDLSGAFADADGDALSYSANVAGVSFAGSVLSFVPDAEGTTDITVTAADPFGDRATVTVSVSAVEASAGEVVFLADGNVVLAGPNAMDAGQSLSFGVSAMQDGVALLVAFDGTSLPAASSVPGTLCSFELTDTTSLVGNHTLVFHAYAPDDTGFETILGTVEIPLEIRAILLPPTVRFADVSHRSFTVLWDDQDLASSYRLRVWTGRSTPDGATGSTNESFTTYYADNTPPAGWTFRNSLNHYGYADNPVDFRDGDAPWVSSPDFGGTITSVSFHGRQFSANGTFQVLAATPYSDAWTSVTTYSTSAGTLTTGDKSISLDADAGYTRLKFQFHRTSGGYAIGNLVVSGVNWPAANFLDGWGGAKISVGSATSQTILRPVPGTVNYVEVTAVGASGNTTTTIASVPVPSAPATVISVW